MIDINRILEWKQTFGDIYQMAILEQHFIFRPIGREEYKQLILMDLNVGEFQEALCFQSIIYPEDYDYSKGAAGIAEIMSDVILDASGLHEGQAPQLIQEFREEMMNYDYQVDCMIHEAFPEFTLEEIATWPVRKTMFYLSRAEWVLETLKGIPISQMFLTPEQQQEMMLQQQQMMQEQMQQQQQQPPNPAQRTIRKELIEAPEEKPKAPPKPAPQGAIQSEEELLAMLAGAGGKVSKPITDLENEQKPELNWFGYMDELKGDFD